MPTTTDRITCTIIRTGRSDEYGNPLTLNQSYTGDFDFVKDLYQSGFASVPNVSVFNDADGMNPVTASRLLTIADSGLVLCNTGTNNITLTVTNVINQPIQLQQESTGTLTVVAGDGVTLIGATLATSAAGGLLTILPAVTPNAYIVKVNS